jgi:hypothetical protein
MTLSALGIFSAAGAGGGVALSDYELIETQILGSAQASVVFSSLGTYSSTYKHLQIRATVRTNRGANEDILGIRFNGDTGSNYVTHLLYGTGSSVAAGETFSGGPSTYIYSAFTAAGSNTANAFSGHVVDLLDPYSTTKNKTIRQLFGQPAGNLVGLFSGLWRNTNAISSITLFPAIGTTLNATSRFSLYGTKG